MTTEAEAREIAAAIKNFQDKDAAQQALDYNNNLLTARNWFDGLPLTTAIDRRTALTRFKELESMLPDNDQYRDTVIRDELRKANDDFKRFKHGN